MHPWTTFEHSYSSLKQAQVLGVVILDQTAYQAVPAFVAGAVVFRGVEDEEATIEAMVVDQREVQLLRNLQNMVAAAGDEPPRIHLIAHGNGRCDTVASANVGQTSSPRWLQSGGENRVAIESFLEETLRPFLASAK